MGRVARENCERQGHGERIFNKHRFFGRGKTLKEKDIDTEIVSTKIQRDNEIGLRLFTERGRFERESCVYERKERLERLSQESACFQ